MSYHKRNKSVLQKEKKNKNKKELRKWKNDKFKTFVIETHKYMVWSKLDANTIVNIRNFPNRFSNESIHVNKNDKIR